MAYTYLLKCVPENKFYYGVKYSKDSSPESFWKDYFTSSIHIHKLIEKYGKEAFEYEIRKAFINEDSARNWERNVIRRMNMHKRLDFINRSVPGENFGFGVGEKNPMFENREKIRHSWSNRMVEKYGINHNWKLPEFAIARSKRMSKTNSKQVICPHCNKRGGQINMIRYHFNNCKKIKGELL